MKNFDKKRFLNYGRYDLAINRKFYRNMALSIVFVLSGIASLGFFIRWMEWQNLPSTLTSGKELIELSCSGTASILLFASYVILTFLAGYAFHNLRTRQGRINELTLPATMKEKFWWHILFNLAGGLLFCLIGIVLADALNALLTAVILPHVAQHSLTVEAWKIASMEAVRSTIHYSNGMEGSADVYLDGGLLMTFCGLLFNLSVYVYGNSIKYHYNIILTYVTTKVVSFTLLMLLVAMCALISSPFCISNETAPNVVKAILFGGSAVLFLLAVLFTWRAYVRYSRARIISKLNK